MSGSTTKTSTKYLRTALVLLIIVLAFAATYQLAVAAGRKDTTSSAASASTSGFKNASPAPQAGSSAGSSTYSNGSDTGAAVAGAAGGCCGGAGSDATIEGTAVTEGGVQRVTVNTNTGYYNPNVITLAAGVPAEITFGRASGCLVQVISKDLGFSEDLTSGDKTIKLAADILKPGTYSFSCGMQMVFGTIIVK